MKYKPKKVKNQHVCYNENCDWYELHNIKGYWSPVPVRSEGIALLFLDQKITEYKNSLPQ